MDFGEGDAEDGSRDQHEEKEVQLEEDIEQQLQREDSAEVVEVVEVDNIQENQMSEMDQKNVVGGETMMERLPEDHNGQENSSDNRNVDSKVFDVTVSLMKHEEEVTFVKEVDVDKDLVCDGCHEERDDKKDHFNFEKSLMQSQKTVDEDEPSLTPSTVMDIHVQHLISTDASIVVPSEVQAGPPATACELEEDAEALTRNEHPGEDSNGGEIECSVSHIRDADGTVGEDNRKTEQAQMIAMSVTDYEEQLQTALTVTELDDISLTGQPGNDETDVLVSQFPALDNVDFETDEEGQEGERHIEKGHEEETGQRVTVEGIRHTFEGPNSSDSEVRIQAVSYVSVDSDGAGNRVSVLANSESVHKDYPLNYQNYKVCRELRPGVKECLILETGEQFIYITKPKLRQDGSSDSHLDNVDVNYSVQSDHASVTESPDYNQPTSTTETGGRERTNPSDVLENTQQIHNTENGVIITKNSVEGDSKQGLGTENGRFDAEVPESGKENVFYSKHDDDEAPREDIVEDILSSGEVDNRAPYSENNEPSWQKSKRKKQNGFIEVQPEISADYTEDTAESDTNNSSNQRDLEGEENTNENANFRYNVEKEVRRGTVPTTSPHYSSNRYYHTGNSDHAQSYDHYITGPRGLRKSGTNSYSHSASRESSCFGDRGHRSKEDSSYFRSREPSSVDTSHISARYKHIELGDPRNVTSKSESLTVPKFKTLQDQQVSWLEMFKMIEQQHRKELQSQYLEHQKILQDMQKNMEKELLKQQDTLKKRLLTHREMLEELSPGRQEGHNVNQSWARNEGDMSSMDSQKSSENALTNSTSHTTLQGIPVALKNPPPILEYHHEHKSPKDFPVKRSLERDFSSPVRPADTSLNLSSRVSIESDKQLRGGVYSSPLPLAKVKHKKSARGSKSYENTHHDSPLRDSSHNTNSVHWAYESRQSPGSVDVSLTESDHVHSPRTTINVGEKHAKHLQTYEKELREVKQERQLKGSGNGLTRVTEEHTILAIENQELRHKCHHLQDAYHDAKIEIRELQQKIQGLEIRAADYADRYKAAQSQVLSLKSRLEELTDFAREKESAVADLESKNRKNIDSLQIAYKKEKELAESLHNAKSTIQKLVDKYETLEKDHDILKESLAESQQKLYSSRGEVMDTNTKLSRLELENKQLKHDIEILKHDLTMARSAITVKTSYDDAYHKTSSFDRGRSSHTARTKSMERSYENHPGERQNMKNDVSPDSESDSDYLRSPIIKAERELKKLQLSPEFTPKLQHKFYGTEVPSSSGGPPITVDRTSSPSARSTQSSQNRSPSDKKTQMAFRRKEDNSKSSIPFSSYLSRSQRESLRLSKENEKNCAGGRNKEKDSNRISSISPERTPHVTNGLTSDQAIEGIKSGGIVSRPAWEDVYTSLASGRPQNSKLKESPINYAREHMIRERLQNIENLEKKYDDLSNEKRKFEACLSKLPVQGHGRERDRLENELDRVDRELGSVRMSLKRYHVLKSTR